LGNHEEGPGKKEDGQTFIAMLDEFTAQLEPLRKERPYYLTSAVGAIPFEYINTTAAEYAKRLDWINVMFYDVQVRAVYYVLAK
jgi:GH18 family chitinase